MFGLGTLGCRFGRLGGVGGIISNDPLLQFSGSVAENAANGTLIGTVTISGVYTGTPTFAKGGTDAALITLNTSTGAVTKNGSYDYETAPTLSVTFSVSGVTPDPLNDPLSATIFVTDIDEVAPTITSANSANNPENTVLAHALTANEAVTWSITGGADAADFEISGSTLRWAGNGTQDYESPNDADTNNTYVVQVTATDAATNATNQTITITVTDVGEGGGSAGEPMGLLLTLTKAA